VFGVGHPEKALAPVRRADARSAQIGSPAGISQFFQVKANSGEPFTSILARNLLAKHRCRSALGDEGVKSGPQVPLIGVSLSFASARKRLTGTGTRPDSSDAFKPSPPQREWPASDSGEEVALVESFNLFWSDIENAPFIHGTRRQVALRNQLAQQRARFRIIVVVVVALLAHFRDSLTVIGMLCISSCCHRFLTSSMTGE
jgi:hypothetical protein